ncbi:hypothetical protein CBOM_07821 [Ceraceosorus bombacis]|uniref:Uncharacterized protein n=1 Tax=Ceraceosorus bombacis TaxID=401625 RepID=A0A0P1BP43_9BASI|nr:hypothetical protein CBOM_07821 [Ceraceosorus bombacis]
MKAMFTLAPRRCEPMLYVVATLFVHAKRLAERAASRARSSEQHACMYSHSCEGVYIVLSWRRVLQQDEDGRAGEE